MQVLLAFHITPIDCLCCISCCIYCHHGIFLLDAHISSISIPGRHGYMTAKIFTKLS